MSLDISTNERILKHGLLDLANHKQREPMSVETISGGVILANKRELTKLFSAETTSFIGSVLTRREIQDAFDVGQNRADGAFRYLVGEDDRSQYISFVEGHVSMPKFRAAHLIQHVSFRIFFKLGNQIPNESFTANAPVREIIDLTNNLPYERALYRVDEHHDLSGVAGTVSYLSPDMKLLHDQRLLTREASELSVAKGLIAQA